MRQGAPLPLLLAAVLAAGCLGTPEPPACEPPPWSELAGLYLGGVNTPSDLRLAARSDEDVWLAYAATESISAVDVHDACDPRVADSSDAREEEWSDGVAPRSLLVVRSDDAGGRWTEPVRLSDGRPWYGRILDLAATEASVRLLVAEEGPDGERMRLIRTEDEGASWSSDEVWEVADMGGEDIVSAALEVENLDVGAVVRLGTDQWATIADRASTAVPLPQFSFLAMVPLLGRLVVVTLESGAASSDRSFGIADLSQPNRGHQVLDTGISLGTVDSPEGRVAAAPVGGGLAVFVASRADSAIDCIRLDLAEEESGNWTVLSATRHDGLFATALCGSQYGFVTLQRIDGVLSPALIGLWRGPDGGNNQWSGFRVVTGTGPGEEVEVSEHLFPRGSRYDTRFAVAASPSGSMLSWVDLWGSEAGLVSFE